MDLSICSRMLYHWAIPPMMIKELCYNIFFTNIFCSSELTSVHEVLNYVNWALLNKGWHGDVRNHSDRRIKEILFNYQVVHRKDASTIEYYDIHNHTRIFQIEKAILKKYKYEIYIYIYIYIYNTMPGCHWCYPKITLYLLY